MKSDINKQCEDIHLIDPVLVGFLCVFLEAFFVV